MSETASLPEFSRRLLLSGIAAIPASALFAGALFAGKTPRPGTATAASAPAARSTWPLAAGSAAQEFNGVYFC
jgi:hypothetical protein